MYVCMRVCMCVYMYACMCVCMYVCMCVYMHVGGRTGERIKYHEVTISDQMTPPLPEWYVTKADSLDTHPLSHSSNFKHSARIEKHDRLYSLGHGGGGGGQ